MKYTTTQKNGFAFMPIIIVVVLVALLGGAYYYVALRPHPNTQTPTTTNQSLPGGGQITAACPSAEPACPVPQTPECKNGTWVCVGPARPDGATAPQLSSGGTTGTTGGITPRTTAKTYTISITAQGFSPANIDIAQGDTVTFINNDTEPHWPASSPHPQHTACPGFDALHGLATGETYSFTFKEVKVCPMHDHLNPFLEGSISVQ